MKTLKYHTFLIKYSKFNWDLKNPWFNLKYGEVLNKYTITLKNTVEYDIIQQLRTKMLMKQENISLKKKTKIKWNE